MGDLIDTYLADPAIYDEMLTSGGHVRSHYQAVSEAISQLHASELAERAERLTNAFRDQGVTFDLDGEERPFPLDLMPRIFTSEEWQLVETGVIQRVRALEAFLADIYDSQRILDAEVIPRRVVTSSSQFLRPAHGISPPNGVRIHVAGVDLVRDEAGELRVLEDNLRCPSGVSYVLANRRAMARVLPEIFSGQAIQPVADYPARLIDALRAAAPNDVSDPNVVMLTPGIYNAAFYEHALLARLMGIELVEGSDLICRGTEVFMRTTEGDVRVHVIYRRVDDEFLDPLQFRPDSVVGCPGLVNAARSGSVTVANSLGNGIADDKLVYSYVPEMVRFYLDEEPVLRNVETFRLVDESQRIAALKRRSELVFKQVDSSGGKGMVLGPLASRDELKRLAAAVETEPRSWIAQRLVRFSTAPTWVGEGLAPRHVDLRPFAVNDGESVWVLPGGLSRVALRENGLVVNSSQGGGSKDTWVTGSEPVVPRAQRIRYLGPPIQSRQTDAGPAGIGGQQQ